METVERNEIFDLAFRFITETSESIFLTGKAGTGKTTFLKYLKANCAKNIIVAAPTGVAAINAGGVTLHSLFQLPFHPFLPTAANRNELLGKIRYNRQRQDLLRKMELLVIDEISMVRCDVMDAIDCILKSVRRNHQSPFGGVQVLCIGDLHQLPPVAQNHEWNILNEYYASPFFFDSMAVKEQEPLLISLEKIYRQKEASFVRLLNKIRNNEMDADDFKQLHERYIPGFRPEEGENYITLTSHNNQADQINQLQLQKLFSSPFVYKAVVENEFPEQLYPADPELVLKEGAQVMFLKNDPVQRRYFNGKIGTVISLEKDKVLVDCDGTSIEVQKETWENSRYTLNRTDGKLEQQTLGTFTQYPLRLAWAITIHKSQGLTFERVMIDAASAFSSGQVYVALSRCTSLNGIVLLSKIPPTAIYSNDSVVKGQQQLSHKGSLSERFAGARIAFTQQVLEQLFSFAEIVTACNLLQYHVTQQQDKLNTEASGWVTEIKTQVDAEQMVGLRFIAQISALLKEEPVVEKNGALQKRITAASLHFISKFNAIRQLVQNHPLITEHKEAANIVNEHLHALLLSIHTACYYLEYCKEGFSITGFLQHKLKFSLPRINVTAYASGKKQSASDILHPELYETLKRWRDMEVEQSQLPIYMIANQASLKEVCTFLPLSKKDLQQITGFGKAKAEKYGDEIIDAVESYCSRHGIESNMGALIVSEKKQKKEKPAVVKAVKIESRVTSLTHFKEGKSVEEIAAERNLTKGTIEGHLIPFIESGDIEITQLVNAEKREAIKKAIDIHGTESLKLLLEQVPPGISYNEIKMVLMSLKVNSKPGTE